MTQKPGFVATLTQLATVCGVSATTIKDWKARSDSPIGESGPYDVFAIGKWVGHRDANLTGNNKQKRLNLSDDPLLSGFDSPALEAYRQAKAALANLDLAERERELIPLDRLQQFHSDMAAVLRQASDTLQRHHGPEALAIIEEALREMDRKRNDFFGTDDAAGADATGD